MAMAGRRARHLKALQTVTTGDAFGARAGRRTGWHDAALGIADQGFRCTWSRRKQPSVAYCASAQHSRGSTSSRTSANCGQGPGPSHVDVYLNATLAGITAHRQTSRAFSMWAGASSRSVTESSSCDGWSGTLNPAVSAWPEPPCHDPEQARGAAGRDELPRSCRARPTHVVMIQCVESRNEEHPYCSRVCARRPSERARAQTQLPGANVAVLAAISAPTGSRAVLPAGP